MSFSDFKQTMRTPKPVSNHAKNCQTGAHPQEHEFRARENGTGDKAAGGGPGENGAEVGAGAEESEAESGT